MNFKDIFWGIILIVAGAFFAVRDLRGLEIGVYFWPVILITAGGLLLLKNNIRANQ